MYCKNHPDREVVIPCQKHQTGYCDECVDKGISCTDPTIYCKFRSLCVIWEMGREDRKKVAIEQAYEATQAAC
ncbi:MAG: hypothetical protein GY846_10315 [Deltaproteobacteria bacterium]|nr:hypothetical protein [Deltaproteobacteria bacterium]